MIKLASDKDLEDVILRYSEMIIRIAFQYVRNKADSEDIAQEVFYSLVEHTDFETDGHLKAWLIRVTINKSKDVLKSASRRHNTELKEDYPFTKEDNTVLQALDELGEKDRSIIYLFYYEGYSAKEIGEILGKKEGAITMQLTRARRKLKQILEG